MALLDRLFGAPRRVNLRGRGGGGGAPTGSSSVLHAFASMQMIEQDRLAKLRDFREMAEYSDVATFLTVTASEATLPDRMHNASVWIDSESEQIRDQWEIMIKRLKIDEKLTTIARNLVHFGEVFFYNAIRQSDQPSGAVDDEIGISWLLYDDPENVEAQLDERRQVIGYKSLDIVPAERGPAAQDLMKPYEFTHFRLMAQSLMTESGDSLLLPVRKIWRMLKMMEDSTVIYRLIKGPARLVYYIDVGNQRPEDAAQTVRRWKQTLRRRSFLDVQSGRFDERWLGVSVEEDIYWPVRTGSQSKVEMLNSPSNLPHIEDVKYFRDKLYAGLNMPKSFFSQDETQTSMRGSALAMQDIWFARTVRQVQKSLMHGLRRMFDIHLAAMNINPRESANRYKMYMHPPSHIEEMQELDNLVNKFHAGEALYDIGVKVGAQPAKWFTLISKEVLNLPEALSDQLNKLLQDTATPPLADLGTALPPPPLGQTPPKPPGTERTRTLPSSLLTESTGALAETETVPGEMLPKDFAQPKRKRLEQPEERRQRRLQGLFIVKGQAVVVEAVQVDVPTPIESVDGPVIAKPGAWIVTSVGGEQTVEDEENFARKYLAVGAGSGVRIKEIESE
jgi:hypothetical protein